MHLVPLMAPADNQPGGGQNHFCPNCGHPVAPDDVFCQNCGYNLQADDAAPTNQSTDEAPQPAQPTQTQTRQATPQPAAPVRRPRQPMTKAKKIQWWSIGGVVVLLIIFFVWGSQHYSRAATLDREIANIKSGKHLTTTFTSGSSDLKLSKTKLLPVNRYYGEHAKALATLKTELQTSGTSNDGNFTYKQNGHHLFFFPKYQISVSPVYPTVTTNHTGNVIKLDNQKIATATTDDYTKKLGAMVPGEYHLQSSGKIGSHHLTNSGDYHITGSKTYDLELTTVSVTFNTVPASAIYLNGKKIGNADDSGMYTLNDEPWSSDMSAYAQYSSSAGKATTPAVHISKSDDQSDVDLNYKDMIDESDADDFFDNLFTAVENLSDQGDIDDATDDDDDAMADFFANGSSNTQYDQLKQMAEGYYKDDDLNYIEMDTDIKSVKPGPNGTSLVSYTVKYDFTLDDYDHIQTFQYTATLKPAGNDNASQSYEITKISASQKVNDYHEDSDD
ncbi:zinc ribbon domain-containing protein [Levilactobacillus tujiorum]|uniref:zinc ribbon domain-containing protein n=1 Tax=Levilactobacillus tujiorum TaxID=2912243 RepID=UPI00145753C0|nr:zinc ribbon domain-containing protein [Levilactobacillus tujiorum]NLR32066.1 zinc-ribbon domain-containing protein [Levilactobacillus tujiorum]